MVAAKSPARGPSPKRRKTMRSRRRRKGGEVREGGGGIRKEDVNGESKGEGMKGEMSRSGVREGNWEISSREFGKGRNR